MMPGYYAEKLAAERLRACYDLAPPRVKAYLEAETAFVLERISPSMLVLELGCGYGRVLKRLVPRAGTVVGIDTSLASLLMAREDLSKTPSCHLAAMDAASMGFAGRVFDLTVCIQNGLSAFHVSQPRLVAEAVRVTRSGGRVLFSSYSPSFWNERLNWFELQAAAGLIGEIDDAATGNGVIVCKDGFQATTVSPERFRSLAKGIGLVPKIFEVDGSSLFCEMIIP
jgi:2-polyprenyl-6-hydroxyphenyl methylase/3-demethylubiquinone-9 3-methyltransferase